MRQRLFNIMSASKTFLRKGLERILCLSSVAGKRQCASRGIAFELAAIERINEVTDEDKLAPSFTYNKDKIGVGGKALKYQLFI